MPADFDRVAAPYSLLEHLSFGPYLQRTRTLRLASHMRDRKRALVYGDGDGRFLARLLEAAPAIEVTAVDGSAAMLRQAARRLARGSRVTLVRADALAFAPPADACYDLVVTHFFLDCFETAALDSLLDRVDPAVTPDALWIISDFAIPDRPAMLRFAARVLVRMLYFGFRILTGLRVRRLPEHARVLTAHGWSLLERQTLLGGVLISEVWQRSATARATQPATSRSHLL